MTALPASTLKDRVQKDKSPVFPKLSKYWSARYWHAFAWYNILFKNARLIENRWAEAEMERAVRGAVEELKREGAPYQGNWFEVPRYKVDSVDTPFVRELVKQAKPFVLEGAAKQWGAVKKWNLDYFAENFGHQTVTAKDDLMDSGVFEPRKVADVVANLKAGKPVYTGFSEEILLNNPELFDDINRSEVIAMTGASKERKRGLVGFFRKGTVISVQLFIQGAQSHTTYHMTKFHNFFVEIAGRKEWVLVDPKYGMGIDQKPSAAYYFISPKPVDAPDSPDDLYSYLPKMHTIVEPGDILFVPSYWWHDVQTYASDHVIGMATRASGWTLENPLLDFLLLFDFKTFGFFYKAFIKGMPLTDAENAVLHIDADLKRLGVAESPAKAAG
ncbi:MAG: hypothetical protein EPN21_13375 [Methylococcaceae bacterium]|nr:MAG: hypothetical protein EPN21_13375 [Methylococcaceae bacterium]